jgi:hypothetical protein
MIKKEINLLYYVVLKKVFYICADFERFTNN